MGLLQGVSDHICGPIRLFRGLMLFQYFSRSYTRLWTDLELTNQIAGFNLAIQ